MPGANLYGYAAGNPVSLRDPTGQTSVAEEDEVMVWGNQLSAFRSGIFNAVFSGVDQAARCGLDARVLKSAGIGFLTGAAGGWFANKLFRALGRPAGRFEGQIGLFMANALTGGLSVL